MATKTEKQTKAEADANAAPTEAGFVEAEVAAHSLSDIKPNFVSLDEDALHTWFEGMTEFFDKTGAKVTGPKITETQDWTECFYEWEYPARSKSADPLINTVRAVGVDTLAALRLAGEEVFNRRNQIG